MASKPLTKELIATKCKTDKLNQVKNLNLFGNQLQDVSILSEMPNLEIASLSLNNITSLREFSKCSKLTELYLRKNQISDLNEIRYLSDLPNLRVLWLSNNPCAENNSDYRKIVISILPNLQKLDNVEISQEERD